MKPRRTTLLAIIVSALLYGCATTEQEMTQKERDKIDRDMQKANRQNAQAQEKAMRSTGPTKQAR